jgi:hypothetical protein
MQGQPHVIDLATGQGADGDEDFQAAPAGQARRRRREYQPLFDHHHGEALVAWAAAEGCMCCKGIHGAVVSVSCLLAVCRQLPMYAGSCLCMQAAAHVCRQLPMYAGSCLCMQAAARVCRQLPVAPHKRREPVLLPTHPTCLHQQCHYHHRTAPQVTSGHFWSPQVTWEQLRHRIAPCIVRCTFACKNSDAVLPLRHAGGDAALPQRSHSLGSASISAGGSSDEGHGPAGSDDDDSIVDPDDLLVYDTDADEQDMRYDYANRRGHVRRKKVRGGGLHIRSLHTLPAARLRGWGLARLWWPDKDCGGLARLWRPDKDCGGLTRTVVAWQGLWWPGKDCGGLARTVVAWQGCGGLARTVLVKVVCCSEVAVAAHLDLAQTACCKIVYHVPTLSAMCQHCLPCANMWGWAHCGGLARGMCVKVLCCSRMLCVGA